MVRAAGILMPITSLPSPYGIGTLGQTARDFIQFLGNMDTCIAIRLAFKKNGKVFVRSGAGIVADSVPEKEHQECINKAKAVMVALAEAEGGSNL